MDEEVSRSLGALAHAFVLREMGESADSRTVSERTVNTPDPDQIKPRSDAAYLYFRACHNRIWLLARTSSREACQDAHKEFDELRSRLLGRQLLTVGPPGNEVVPYEALNRLALLANALRRYGDGLGICREVDETRLDRPERISYLNTLAVFRREIGFEKLLAGQREEAVTHAERGVEAALRAKALRDEGNAIGQVSARLNSDVQIASSRFVLCLAMEQNEARVVQLTDLLDKVEGLVRLSYTLPSSSARQRLSRASLFGEVGLVRADASAGLTAADAMRARVLMKPHLDLQARGQLVGVRYALHYGDACLVSGDAASAERVWRVGLARAVALSGSKHPSSVVLGGRLERCWKAQGA
ncbi:MAG: hypothetical protein U0Y82_11465 [Thermoleophilia bacterium]